MIHIDINCDAGEIPELVEGGRQESLMPLISSVNIACGGHAGDPQTMRSTIEQALRHNVAIGAHPGYPDRANFGRLPLDMPVAETSRIVEEQVRTLAAVAASCGARVVHVKPHGALYNQAARHPDIAIAIAEGVLRVDGKLALVGLAGSPALRVFREAGLQTLAEAFADRRYDADGHLRSRQHADALIEDPEEAGRQAVRIAVEHSVLAIDGAVIPLAGDTLCVHSDSPNAAALLHSVRRALDKAAVTVTAMIMGAST